MIEILVKNWLGERLPVPVGLEVPPRPPDTFVVLEKTSSARRDHICRATMALQSYGPTLEKAARLNEQLKTAMDALSAHPGVGACRLNSDGNFTDTDSRRYRYQAVYDLTYYESVSEKDTGKE